MDKVYAVYLNKDTTEGRGTMLLKGIFTDRADAEKAARELEPYKRVSGFTEIKETVVYDSYEDWSQEGRRQTAQEGFAKLTSKEKEALGLPQTLIWS